jgi:transcriptional regulator with XRE-family HTH domain
MVSTVTFDAYTRCHHRSQVRTLHERLNWICDQDKINLTELAKRAGLTKQAVSRIHRLSRKGKQAGLAETLTAIAAGNNVSLEWLQTGIGVPREDALSTLEHVLAERAWSPTAVAAARASSRQRPASEWRRFLAEVERVEATPEPPSSFARPVSSRPKP